MKLHAAWIDWARALMLTFYWPRASTTDKWVGVIVHETHSPEQVFKVSLSESALARYVLKFGMAKDVT